MHAVHCFLHHLQGRPGGADQSIPGFQRGCDQLLQALHHSMGAEGMGDAGEREVAGSAVCPQPAPVV